MKYISEEELYSLAFDHKYASRGSSILDKHVMSKFWSWLVECLPSSQDPSLSIHWSAPYSLTLGGLFFMVVPAIITIISCQDLSSPAPQWVYLLNAIGIFIYQTCDALDGKQARRTGSQSSFGELFDHGCDAISTIFAALSSIYVLQLGTGWYGFVTFLSAMASFAGAHIQVKPCMQTSL